MGNPEPEPEPEQDQFEFWMVGNPLPSFPEPQHLLTADQLFAGGIILPLHSLSLEDDQHNSPLPPPPPPPTNNSIKKWKHINIFATRPKLNNNNINNNNSGSGCNTTVTATAITTAIVADQLNIIHIWPFSRSRSTGTRPPSSSSTKARFHNYVKAHAGRKASSAPCSRSNSRGDQQQEQEEEDEKEECNNSHGDQLEDQKKESSSMETTTTTMPAAAPPPVKKKWGPLVGGVGVRVGRSMPVWQMRRGTSSSRGGNTSSSSSSCDENGESSSSKALLNHLNVNVSSSCIGYESSNGGSCGSTENKDGVTGRNEANGDGNGGGSGATSGGLFNLKGIFSKKVY